MGIAPEFAYYCYDHKGRLVLVLRFETIFQARAAYRKIRYKLQSRSITHWVSRAGEEPNRGTYEIDITFKVGVADEEICRSFNPLPLIGG